MSRITSTNVRVGPGVYLALKEISEVLGLSIGACANLLIVSTLISYNKNLTGFSPETKNALVADAFNFFGDLIKMIGMATIKNTSVADLYKSLLSPQKNKNIA